MEASAGTPLKPKRNAYKPMWEQAERELRAVRTLLHSVEDRAVEYARKLAETGDALQTARKASRYYWRNLVGFAVAAIVEAIALLLLLARS